MVELADAPDSKSGDGDIVRVQVPPSAPTTEGSPLRQKYEAVLLPHIFCFLARFLPCAKAGSSEIVTLTRLDIFCQAVPFRRSLFRRFAPYKSRLRHQKPELTCSGFFSVPMRDLEPAQTTPSFPCAARSRTAPRCPLSALPVRQVPPLLFLLIVTQRLLTTFR